MNRKDFLQLLGLSSFLGTVAPKTVIAQKKKNEIYHNYIRGTRYYDVYKVSSKLELGDKLILRREPQNEYDKYAIEVLYRDHKIGYIPRFENKAIAKLMDHGTALEAEISRLDIEEGILDGAYSKVSVGLTIYMHS